MSSHAAASRLPAAHASDWIDCRLLVDSVVDQAIVMLDREGHVVSWNQGAENIEGYTRDEILGQHFSKFYTAEDISIGRPEQELARARADGRTEGQGFRVRKDGSRYWANTILTALHATDGELRGYAKVTRELGSSHTALSHTTVPSQDSREPSLSEEPFRQLVNAVEDYAIFMLDSSGRVSTWNVGARKIKGYAEQEIVGQHFSVFYTAEDRAMGIPARILEAVRRDGRYEAESWRVRKDGSRFWANVVITALRDQGTLLGFAKVTRDLSERRAAEEALRKSEERFRLLLEGVGDHAIFMLDPNGRINTWNEGAQRLMGHAAEEIAGQHFRLLFSPRDAATGKPEWELSRAMAEGQFEVEGWRLRKDGSRFWANVILTPLRNDRGQLLGYANVTRDLTERRQAEEMRRTLEREQAAREMAEIIARKAEETNRIQDEFLATVSHELRTPLNAIIGWAKILRQEEVGPTLAKGLEVIDRNAEAQLRIVEDILDVSRVITGKLRIEPKAIDLAAVAEAAVEAVRPTSTAKEVMLTLQRCPEPCLLMGDPERLQQVVWNLLSNAIKFTPRGGSVNVTLACGEGAVGLTVTDQGRGIDPQFLPHVFDRFKQADSSTTRRHGGLGLGLALVRHIVELHGGEVAAESQGIGYGATFRFTLPSRASIPPPGAGELSPVHHLSGVLSGVRALVVDDDPDARDLLDAVLTGGGALVRTAGSAKEAFEVLQTFTPQLLISDIGMPGEDGLSFVRRVRALPQNEGGNVRAVALTAYTRDEDRDKALEAGFNLHMAKPINPNELLTALVRLKASN